METIQVEPSAPRKYAAPSSLRATSKLIEPAKEPTLHRSAPNVFEVLRPQNFEFQGSGARTTVIAPAIAHDIEVIILAVQDAAVRTSRAFLGATAGAPVLSLHAIKSAALDAVYKPPTAAKLRVERISEIQAALGVPMQTLACILKISRPCLYKWIDAEQSIALHPDNRERLATIERLVAEWRKQSRAPLSVVAQEPLKSGHTIIDLLTQETISQKAVLAAFEHLADKLKSKPKSLSQRMAEKGFTRRPSSRLLPLDDE